MFRLKSSPLLDLAVFDATKKVRAWVGCDGMGWDGVGCGDMVGWDKRGVVGWEVSFVHVSFVVVLESLFYSSGICASKQRNCL